MDKMRIVDVLKRRTMGMFNDDWYDKTANELFTNAQKDKGYVYFIRYYNSEHVKIGKARDLLNRLSSFKTSNHQRLVLIGFIYTDDYNELEKKIHDSLKEYRESGEWFLINHPIVIDAISSNNGTFCNAFYDKKLSIDDGILFSANFLGKSSISVYKEIYLGFDSIIKTGRRYTKDEIINNFDNLKQLSKKKIGSLIKEYAKLKGYSYIDGNSNGFRWFKLEK